jgi:small redox-active disulfide protein 2
MEIKILGTGCTKCRQTEQATREVVTELGIDATIEEVRDINKILEYPILTTPGLVIDGELVTSGHVPTREEVRQFIVNALENKERPGK